MLPLLLLTYPLVSHFATVTTHSELCYLWMGLILISAGVGRSANGKVSWSLVSGLVLIGASIGLADQLADLPAKLLPILAYSGLSLFFAYSLLPGKTPLITRIMLHLRGAVPPRVHAYCRLLTLFWALFLFLLGIQSLALSLFASASLWSAFTNFVNPVLIVLVFVVEYPIRLQILKEVSHKGFFDYVRDLIRTGLPLEDSRYDARK